MTTTIALGNCPSSGSTFLADLLDGTPYSAVGPELNLFSIEKLYEEKSFSRFFLERSRCSSVYLRRNGLVFNDLCAFGLDQRRLEQMIDASEGLDEFLGLFARNFLALRGKRLDGVVFEKSPQNIHCIRQYLSKTENPFIHIVRNPVDVFLSLKKRGFSTGIALITWLLDEAKMFDFFDHDRVRIIRYEDLIDKPFQITANLLRSVGEFEVVESEIEAGFKNNRYREYHTIKLASWNQKDFGKTGKSKRRELSSDDIQSLATLKQLKVSKAYAELFDLAEVSFVQLLSKLGYEESFNAAIGNAESDFKLSASEQYKLSRKFTGDLKQGDARLSDIRTYIKPVETE
jgi:hypothetical protein